MIDMKQIMPFVIILAFLVIIAVIVIHLMNYRLKKRILDQGTYDDVSMKLLHALSGNGSDILKWGIIFLFGGIGLVVLEFIPYSAEDSSLPYGVEAIFLALGFLTYYFILKKDKGA
jgi:hypothetical protein